MSNHSHMPYHLHDFISRLTDYIETTITTKVIKQLPIKTLTDVKINLNVLYRNPRFKAKYYFTPLKENESLPATNSTYYKYLCKLLRTNKHLLPSSSDLEPLIKIALNSQLTISALHTLYSRHEFQEWQIDHEFKNVFGSNISTDLRFITGLFDIFIKLNDAAIKELNAHELLSHIVNVLLCILPQFDDAECAMMDKNKYYCDQKDKIAEWDRCKNIENVKSETKYFYLLSILESLRWFSDSNFVIIDDLFKFLAVEGIYDSLSTRQLPLSRLSVYLNCKGLLSSQLIALKPNMQQILSEHVDVLLDLVRTFNIAIFKRDIRLNGNMLNGNNELVAQGMLNILATDEFDIVTKLNQEETMLTRYYRNTDKSPSEILDSPWGIYKLHSTDKLNDEFRNYVGTHHYVQTDDGFIVNHIDDDASIYFRWKDKGIEYISTNNSSLFLGDLFANLRNLPWQLSLQYDCDWYLRAFDKYYVEFDKIRQEKLPQFIHHKSKELKFYLDFIEAEFKGRSLNIIDVGIGYGRLALKLLNAKSDTINICGVDVSNQMAIAAKEYLTNQHTIPVYMCEMVELDHFVGKDTYDLAIMAFTTFGCYDKDDKNLKTLEAIYASLKPGGYLIIEQFNPLTSTKIEPYGETLTINNEEVTLIKTTDFMNDPYNLSAVLYTGDYLYYRKNASGIQLARRDHYQIKLYNTDWLKKSLENIGYADIKFKANFNFTEDYDKYDKTTSIMICIAKKDKHEETLSKDKIKEAIRLCLEFLKNQKSNRNPLYSKCSMANIDIDSIANESSSIYKKLSGILSKKVNYNQLLSMIKEMNSVDCSCYSDGEQYNAVFEKFYNDYFGEDDA